MKRIDGGSTVKGGYYWNLTKWEIANVQGETGVLPVPDRYLSVPLPLLFVVAPVMGAAYVMFLPFVGFAMFFYAIGRRVGLVSGSTVSDAAATMSVDFAPGAAYLAGKPDEKKDGEPAKMEKLDELAKEVDEKRKQ